MIFEVIRGGIRGKVTVGRKYITFHAAEITSKVGEIHLDNEGNYVITGTLLYVKNVDRKEAVLLALRKSGIKIL